MIGVVVPAHNEEADILACLDSLLTAAASPKLMGEPVQIVVVLDACSDRTGSLAASRGVTTLVTEVRNVGVARSLGARHCLDAGARWLAFTDADTVVEPDWLAAQLGQASDVVCGTVGIRSWAGFLAATRVRYEAHYTDADGHRHIHGANLGVSAPAYLRAGGFQALTSSEDVALVRALETTGATIAWSAAPRVATSTRRHFKAPGGFGALLAKMDTDAAAMSLSVAAPAA